MLQHRQPSRYNILFIMCDQLRADAVGYNNQHVHTPNIDRLAAQSIRFNNHFVQSPQCCPSRASLLSGEYPGNIGMYWNDDIYYPPVKTFGEYFSQDGYSTGYFGKFHVQGDITPNPFVAKLGFKTNYLYNNWIRDGKGKQYYEQYMQAYDNPGLVGKIVEPEKQHDHIIVDRAIQFIKSTDAPHLSFVSFHGPHAPYSCPDKYKELYHDSPLLTPPGIKPQGYYTRFDLTPKQWIELKTNYYGCISWIDYQIGRLLNQCDMSNTIIVFTADHGDILGDHGLWDKGLYAYDSVVKVPLLIKAPDVQPCDYQYLTEAVDILKTLVDHVGLRYFGLPEQTRNNLINDASNDIKSRSYVYSAIGKHQPRIRMVRTEDFKYWWGKTDPTTLHYLFDLKEDPGEEVNIASSNHDVASYMKSLLIEALVYSGA
ncbi:sulfatase-like hydrolase/transferase [bacterium]|nr:sulfatase-like hydrolase/transferase [bacterium]